jgi:hypothetical protein
LRRSTRLWILAVLLTLGSALWQRMSGPSYPLRVRAELGDVAVRARLMRNEDTGRPLPVRLQLRGAAADSAAIGGEVVWRRYPSAEDWNRRNLAREGSSLVAEIPTQPAAGKVQYRIEMRRGPQTRNLPADRLVVARFKGHVPLWLLLPHILVMFGGMLWSSRAGLEALVNGDAQRRQALVACLLLLAGGLVLGPLVQKMAFGAFWTGWPLGEDLTDNKLAVAVLAWVVAVVRLRSSGGGRWAVVLAALITLVVFVIPHSLRGSTLDYETMQTISH